MWRQRGKRKGRKDRGIRKPSRESSVDLGGWAVHMKKTALVKGWGGEGDNLDRHRVAEGLWRWIKNQQGKQKSFSEMWQPERYSFHHVIPKTDWGSLPTATRNEEGWNYIGVEGVEALETARVLLVLLHDHRYVLARKSGVGWEVPENFSCPGRSDWG